ncbi:Transmembrane protein 231 like protein [Argiope bruennichi]|uniref:Transmembrane protein 231 n=1 Tax=Argiope bruennichi TaxID=94029 RepID=A0A8T0FQL4_ARGBR|nr:Transmembrane protein 231 like protein [Argiope bruennichi]
MLLLLETQSPDELIFWSTFKQLNQLMNHELLLTVPLVEHREEDHNRDGKKDELVMTIDVPLLPKKKIVSVKLLLMFDYKFFFSMECAAYIQYSTSLPGSSFSTFGELSLMQRQPLRHAGKDDRFNCRPLAVHIILLLIDDIGWGLRGFHFLHAILYLCVGFFAVDAVLLGDACELFGAKLQTLPKLGPAVWPQVTWLY